MLTQLAEAVDPDTSSEGIEKELRKNLAEFFSEIFTEAILPLATKIDNDFNNGEDFLLFSKFSLVQICHRWRIRNK